MFTTDQEYSIPRNDQVLWRYMDFSKFVSMLEEESLYFCRADVLRQGDPYEGSLTRGEHIYRTAYNRVATDMIKAVSPLLDGNLIKHVSQEMHEKISIESYINCWHMNEQESLAMWKVYSNSGNGVAIKTTFKRLIDSLQSTPETVTAGIVKYQDYFKEEQNSRPKLSPDILMRKPLHLSMKES